MNRSHMIPAWTCRRSSASFIANPCVLRMPDHEHADVMGMGIADSSVRCCHWLLSAHAQLIYRTKLNVYTVFCSTMALAQMRPDKMCSW